MVTVVKLTHLEAQFCLATPPWLSCQLQERCNSTFFQWDAVLPLLSLEVSQSEGTNFPGLNVSCYPHSGHHMN